MSLRACGVDQLVYQYPRRFDRSSETRADEDFDSLIGACLWRPAFADPPVNPRERGLAGPAACDTELMGQGMADILKAWAQFIGEPKQPFLARSNRMDIGMVTGSVQRL
jgi:hypothetical protein